MLSLFLSLGFILLFGSGFVAAKIGMEYSSPLFMLAIRFFITTIVLGVLAIILRPKWPASWKMYFHIAIAGALIVGVFSIGSWVAISMGLPPAFSALIIALQPLLVAILSSFMLRESVGIQQWIGLILGLIGVALVVGEGATFNSHYLIAVIFAVIGLLGMALGNLYQKKFCSQMNVYTGGFIQSGTSAILCLILGALFGRFTVEWTTPFILSLLWLSVIVSTGAMSCLYLLLRNGEANKVASIFYLVPIVVAVIAYCVFGTTLTHKELLGMLITVVGVSLVNVKLKRK